MATVPRLPHLTIPTVQSVGGNVYYYRGLYPPLNTFVEFVIPCVWSRPVSWVRRKLSLEEMMSVYDVPVEFIAL